MPVTLTIKQVPERVADKLRLRAAASHRSLQGELMAILEDAVLQGAHQARQPEASPYKVKPPAKPSSKAVPTHGARLTLAEAWERSRHLGPPSKGESAAIIRKLRDERYNH